MHNMPSKFPYKYPAIFSMPLAFFATWLFSVIDNSEQAKREQAAFEAQLIRSETGLGAEGAVAHE